MLCANCTYNCFIDTVFLLDFKSRTVEETLSPKFLYPFVNVIPVFFYYFTQLKYFSNFSILKIALCIICNYFVNNEMNQFCGGITISPDFLSFYSNLD